MMDGQLRRPGEVNLSVPPRGKPSADSPVHGGLFHVMGRGLERRNIFNCDEDKVDFLPRLDVGLKKSGYACYSGRIPDLEAT